jgi:hypothetical protein
MLTIEPNITIQESAGRRDFTGTAILGAEVLASEINIKERLAVRWSSIIDGKLIEWGKTRSEFEVEDLVGPTNEAIGTAFRFVKYMRSNGWPLPTGVIPDGEGGVVFENRHDPMYQRIEIDKDGRASLATFHDCQLMERVPIDIE